MRPLASLLLMLMLLAMTPQARIAFGEITKAEIICGTINTEGVQRLDAMIEAVGWKDGVLMWISCKWRNGYPVWINFKQLEIIS